MGSVHFELLVNVLGLYYFIKLGSMNVMACLLFQNPRSSNEEYRAQISTCYTISFAACVIGLSGITSNLAEKLWWSMLNRLKGCLFIFNLVINLLTLNERRIYQCVLAKIKNSTPINSRTFSFVVSYSQFYVLLRFRELIVSFSVVNTPLNDLARMTLYI